MVAKQLRLIDLPKEPRAKPRKLMHVWDAGCGHDKKDLVKFKCARCGTESDWKLMLMSDAKRGIPCPTCNPTTTSQVTK